MRLTYTAQARADLDAIADYLNARSPAGARRVALEVRKIVEPQFGYLIHYAVAPNHDEIVILHTGPGPHLADGGANHTGGRPRKDRWEGVGRILAEAESVREMMG